jgi:sulfide:quinone oxidoreductase
MSGFRVVVCGGGIAAVEGVLRLRRLAGDGVDVTIVAPDAELRYRPLAVQEPFARPGARRYPLSQVAGRAGAEFVQQAVEWIDGDAQVVHTGGGEPLPYDAVLIAVGARAVPAFEHVTTFDDANADDTFRGIVQDIEDGYNKRMALVVPEGPRWSLPVYELALQTADRAFGSGFDDVTISVVTPEASPLEVFGAPVSATVAEVLEAAGVRVIAGSRAEVPANRQLIVHPGGRSLDPELIVALPRLEGRGIRGVPSDDHGFTPIDEHCRVVGMGERAFAAGDGADFPVKQGGLGTQQADVAAAGIAALAGGHEPERFDPVLRGALIAGERRRLYFQARLENGTAVDSEVLEEPPWDTGDKVVAEELGDFLRSLDGQG